ncbi:hypothetical protein D0C36_20655 [Mucilaginibacter conchicola]|uniref:histidine kinase n=1 Tax=Mucilaginibacter conchicola TaxID=2303333 RepID=A0A372NQV7_9SPHI|nr:HAMP domain-containing sensor histidine kinase [Mucilaginibacter conchicola]RFZ91339.1 hypothetical protein D0C36_20655 [Mucilaginibacter conchicola]
MTTKKGNFSGTINRILMIFLLFTFVVTTGSFILRHTISRKLENLGQQLTAPSYQQGISDLLVELDMAENSFQKATADGSQADLTAYQHRLDTIFTGLTKIIDHYKRGGGRPIPESRRQLEQKLQQKLELSRQLFGLRKKFDSLLSVTTFDRIHRRIANRNIPKAALRADTIVTTRNEATKLNLFHRLKEALRSTRAVKVVTVREKNNGRVSLSDKSARQLLAQLNSEYDRLANSGQALVLANLNLLTQLRHLTRQLQDIDHIAFERSREATLKAYASATRDLNTFTGIALAAVLIFIIVLLIYIRRLGWAERRLRVESKRAIKLAGQKSEILAIMSHEIRNKLMAINGAVFMLRRSELSPQQEQKVSVINLASGLVLETVNNVLDVSKLEQGYAETRKSGPFLPAEAISDAVEAMRFMAENKGINLDLHSGIDKEKYIAGDSFRLKQILLNLLSNAIKYTDRGGVTVRCALHDANTAERLELSVQDTGVGIAKDRLSQLFTPYQQAGGQKPGTGLGLYLCRQLITQEGGKIAVESKEGSGTVFQFHIDYGKTPAGDQASALTLHL